MLEPDEEYVEVRLPPTAEDTGQGSNTRPRRRRRLIVVGIILIIVVVIIVPVAISSHKFGDDTVEWDDAVERECPDVSVGLGDLIIVKSTISRETWQNDTLPTRVEVMYSNPNISYTISCSTIDHSVTCEIGIASCRNRGHYNINFYNSSETDAQLIFNRSATVYIAANKPVTKIEQVYPGNANTSVFHLNCVYNQDCDEKDVGFYVDENKLIESPHCQSTYAASDGYYINCSAVVLENDLYNNGNGHNIVCVVRSNGKRQTSSRFLMPECSDFAKYDANCSAGTTDLFNCWDQNNATINSPYNICDVIKVCYPLRYTNIQDGGCHLSWCQHTTNMEIDKIDQHFYKPLCSAV